MTGQVVRVLGMAAAASMAACNLAYIRTSEGSERLFPRNIVEQVSFEHRCSPDRIVLIREHAGSGLPYIYDLDVCGRVRRYQCRGASCADVTHAFPPDVLPPPAQPPGGTAPAPPPERPRGPQRCETSADCDVGVCIEHYCRK